MVDRYSEEGSDPENPNDPQRWEIGHFPRISPENLNELNVEITNCDREIADDPSNPIPYLKKAFALLRIGKPWDSLNVSELMIDRFSNLFLGYLMKAYVLYQLNHYEEALLELSTAIDHGGCNWWCLWFKTRLLEELYGEDAYSEVLVTLESALQSAEAGDLGASDLVKQLLLREKALVLWKIGRHNEASEILESKKELAQESDDIFLNLAESFDLQIPSDDLTRALILLDKGDVKEAASLLETLLIQDPENADLKELLVEVYKILGKFKKAIRIIGGDIERNPEDIAKLAYKANLLAADGDFVEAWELVEEILQTDEVPEDELAELGTRALNAQKFDLAERIADRVLQANPQEAQSLVTKGTVMIFRDADNIEAEEMLRNAAALDSEIAVDVYKNIGYIYRESDPIKALRFLDIAKEYWDAANPSVRSFIDCTYGTALSNLERYDEALMHYKKAISYRIPVDEKVIAFRFYSELLEETRSFPTLISELKQHVDKKSKIFKSIPYEVLFRLGRALINQGEKEEAVSVLQSCKNYEDHFEADLLLTRATFVKSLSQEEMDERIGALIDIYVKQLESEIEMFPIMGLEKGLAETIDLIGPYVNKSGGEDAIEFYQALIGEFPTVPILHFRLGELLLYMGREVEALDHIREAVRLEPNITDFKVMNEALKFQIEEKLKQKDVEFELVKTILSGETDLVEFKSTLRTNLHTGNKDKRMELVVLKTIAGFLNTNGGTLIIGMSDDGKPVGIEADGFLNEDRMGLHLVNVVKEHLGPKAMIFIQLHFDDYEDKRVLIVKCYRSAMPIFLKEGVLEKFFIRTGPSTTELSASQTLDYIKHRFER